MINTKEEFLQDFLKSFKFLSDRNSNDDFIKSCQYLPYSEKKQGCAIGKHLDASLCETLDNLCNSGVSDPYTFKMLPEWMQNLGKGFLIDMQNLHDRKSNWIKKGFSCTGKHAVNQIIDFYKLKMDHV